MNPETKEAKAPPDGYSILPNGLRDNYLVKYRGAILITGLTRAGAESFIARHKALGKV